ncbi:MAG: FprA family A-type flavoprotein, partial [Longicatena sp.]
MKQAIQIKPNIYWVGVHDFNCRHFHGDLFPISEGTTYNSYLIVDEEITLIDTVEEEFFDVMMERIHSVIGDKKIDNVIVQHAEPD